MKKVVLHTFIISLLFCLIHAEETSTAKETNMQTVAPSAVDKEATMALQKLEAEKKDVTLSEDLDACPIKAADDLEEDLDENDDFEQEDDEDDWDDEEDGDWDDEDYDDEDEED